MKENSILFSILLLLQLIYKFLIIKFIQHTTGVLARVIRQENISKFSKLDSEFTQSCLTLCDHMDI